MDKIIRVMMDLIACEVCEKPFDKTKFALYDEEMLSLYRLSKTHDLAHLVGDILIKNDLITNNEITEKFRKQIMLAVYRYEKMNCELCRLRKILNEAKIPFMPLKGSVLRQYYPKPWMRTSCDIDILVHKEDLDKAVKLITSKLSYKEGFKSSHDVSLSLNNEIHVELHYDLIEVNCAGNTETVLNSVWDQAVCVSNTSEYTLSDEMFYFYHVAHMAKHFISTGGCGVRSFLDLWVLNHHLLYDVKKRNELLKRGELLTFALEAERLSMAWFDNDEYTNISYCMGIYVINGGVYGTVENCVAVQQIVKGGKVRYAISRIWLSYDILKFHYPSLNGRRILLPLYEIRRWCKLLFCGGAERSLNELRLNHITTDENQMVIQKMLVSLELEK